MITVAVGNVDLRDGIRHSRRVLGDLYFGCGSAAEEAPLWRAMLNRKLTKIIYWPFALPSHMIPYADKWLRSHLTALGAGYALETWQSLDQHQPAELKLGDVELLFVGGGNTFRLLDHVRRHDFLEPVREYWRAGGDYYGGSAGAVLACDSVEIAAGLDPNEPGLQDLAALGLLSGAAVLPHFTDEQLTEAGRFAAEHSTVVLGLPESTGLRCGAGRATVVGAGQLSRVSVETVERFRPGDVLDLDAG